MGRTTKRVKPPFAKNATARTKALGWNWQRLAKEARLPHSTVRDVLAGISPGLEETKIAIAQALGCSLSELYQVDTAVPAPQNLPFPTREFFLAWIENPDQVTVAQAQRLLEQMKVGGETRRAMALGMIFGNFEIAEPYIPADSPKLKALLKAL